MGELKYRIGRFPELPARRVCAPGTCGKAESRAGGAPGIAHFLFLLVLAFALWRVVFCMRSYAPPRARGGFGFCSRCGAGFDPSARLAGARFALLKNRSDFTFAAKGFSAFSIARSVFRVLHCGFPRARFRRFLPQSAPPAFSPIFLACPHIGSARLKKRRALRLKNLCGGLGATAF